MIPRSVFFLAGMIVTACSPRVSVPVLAPPAAIVDGHVISMRAYRERLDVSRQRDPLVGIEQSVPGNTSSQRLEDFTIEQLVREEIIRQEAERRRIKVSEGALKARLAAVRSRAGGEAFDAALSRNGFTGDSFKAFQRAFLAEVALVKAMARERVQSADEALRSGRPFASVAGQWSDDSGTASRGGDAGWLIPTDLPEPELTAAVKTIDAGGRTGIVETARGYVIGSMLERRGDEVHLAVILILAPAADLYSAESKPPWFERWVSSRRDSLASAGKIQIRVGSRAAG